WKSSKHARFYRVFISADNGQTWTMLETVFGRKLLVEQLISGKRYQFKVVPVGLHGEGAESDIASQLAA
ncbi:MAG: fibronectin type III domain-containing protein, partial [Bacteroidota bacterium]